MKTRLVPLLSLLCLGVALAGGAQASDSLDLPTVLQLALAKDPQVLAAQATVARAEAGVALELAKIAPGCTITANYGQDAYASISGTEETTIINFSISQSRPGFLPRLIGGRVVSEVERALWDRADAQAGLGQARNAAVSGAIQKYLAAVKAAELVGLSQGALELAKEDERIARACLEAGTVTRLDGLKAESNREKALLDLETARANRRLALDALLLQIGRPLGAEVTLAPVPPYSPTASPDVETLSSLATKTRAEAISARTAVRKAERLLIQRRNDSSPDLKLSATDRQGNFALSVSLDLTTGDIQWSLGGQWQETTPPWPGPADGLSLGLAFAWSPFDGGVTKALIAAAQVDLDSAYATLSRTEDEIRLEVRQRISDLNLAILRLAQAKRERELAVQTRELAALRYREGVALFSELGQASQALAQAEFGMTQAEYELRLAGVLLDLACGRTPSLAGT